MSRGTRQLLLNLKKQSKNYVITEANRVFDSTDEKASGVEAKQFGQHVTRGLGRNHIASTPSPALQCFVLVKQSDSPCLLQF
jgi:hypothetical protein